MAFTLQWVWNI